MYAMHKTTRNIFWLSFSRVAALVLLFITYTQVFRYLGPFGTGQYQFVLSYVTLFSVVVDFGISQYVVKKVSENKALGTKYFYNFLAAEIVVVLVLYALLLVIGWLSGFEKVVMQASIVAGLGMVLNGLTFPFLAILSAHQDLKKVAVINFANTLVNVSILLAAINFHKYIVFMASQQVFFGITSLLLYVYFIKKHLPTISASSFFHTVDRSVIKAMLIAAIPFALLVGFSTIYNRIDVVIISKMLGYTDTGLYTAAYKFVDTMNFFPAVVSHSLYPAFATLMANGNIAGVRALLERYLRFMVALALPVAVGASILAKPILHILAGPKFESAAPILAVLTWAVAILFTYVVANALVISQLTKFAVYITAVNVVVNSIGNVYLVPRIGIMGAAIMTVVSELLQALFYFYFVRSRITSFTGFAFAIKPLAAVVLMGIVVWLTRSLSIAITLPLGVGVYVVALAVFGFFEQSDVQFIKRLVFRTEKTPL